MGQTADAASPGADDQATTGAAVGACGVHPVCACALDGDGPRWQASGGSPRGDSFQPDEDIITASSVTTLVPRAQYLLSGIKGFSAAGTRALAMADYSRGLFGQPGYFIEAIGLDLARSEPGYCRGPSAGYMNRPWPELHPVSVGDLLVFNHTAHSLTDRSSLDGLWTRAEPVPFELAIAADGDAVVVVGFGGDVPGHNSLDWYGAKDGTPRRSVPLRQHCYRAGPLVRLEAARAWLVARYGCAEAAGDNPSGSRRGLLSIVPDDETQPAREIPFEVPEGMTVEDRDLPIPSPMHFVAGNEPAVGLSEGDRALVVHAIASGDVLWRTRALGPNLAAASWHASDGQRIILSEPTCPSAERATAGCASDLVALDPTDGHERWRAPLPEPVAGPVSMTSELAFVAGRRLHAIDSASGTLVHSTGPIVASADDAAAVVPLAIAAGHIYVATTDHLTVFGAGP